MKPTAIIEDPCAFCGKKGKVKIYTRLGCWAETRPNGWEYAQFFDGEKWLCPKCYAKYKKVRKKLDSKILNAMGKIKL